MLNKVDIEYMILLRNAFFLSWIIVFSFKVSRLTLILAILIFVWIIYLFVQMLLQRNCNHRHAMTKDEYARMRERQIKSFIHTYIHDTGRIEEDRISTRLQLQLKRARDEIGASVARIYWFNFSWWTPRHPRYTLRTPL